MEIEIIPTVFSLDKKTFDEKLRKLSFSSKLHIDFMDGIFVNSKSIELNKMDSLLDLKEKHLEIHLMAKNPNKYAKEVKTLGIKGVLIQYEAFSSDDEFENSIDYFKERGLYVFAVLNPATSHKIIYPFIEKLEGVMLMSVWPGMEGQSFIESTIEKIKNIRKDHPNFNIQVDGGIKLSNLENIIDAGANRLCIGSAISSNENPEKIYKQMVELAQKKQKV